MTTEYNTEMMGHSHDFGGQLSILKSQYLKGLKL